MFGDVRVVLAAGQIRSEVCARELERMNLGVAAGESRGDNVAIAVFTFVYASYPGGYSSFSEVATTQNTWAVACFCRTSPTIASYFA